MQATDTRYQDHREPGSVEPSDDGRGLGTLLKDIRDETTTLFQQEIALARTEMSEKVSRVTRNLIFLAAGALVAFAGVIVLLIALGEGVSAALIAAGMETNALWIGPLLVGIVVAAIGIGLVLKGKKTLADESIVPEKTVETMKENKEWLQQKAK